MLMASVVFCAKKNEGEKKYSERIFDKWLSQAFGFEVSRDSAGKLNTREMPELAARAKDWIRINGQSAGKAGAVRSSVKQQGDFMLIDHDLAGTYHGLVYARRAIIYYTGENPYVLVSDNFRSSKPEFWEWRLPVPVETVPVNWNINFPDSDREADLLAALDGEFVPDVGLNKPVSGYSKTTPGCQMLLARLLKCNDQRLKGVPQPSPMNICQDAYGKWLSAESRSDSPDFKILLMPYLQNQDELPHALISKNSVRLDWYRKSHIYTFFPQPDGKMNIMIKEKNGDKIGKFAFGMEYVEDKRPVGKIIASYDFEKLDNDSVDDRIGGFAAKFENGRLVEGLDGKSLYLGGPKERKNPVNTTIGGTSSGIKVPAKIFENFKDGHMSVSMWLKGPVGQDGDNWFWPIVPALRSAGILNMGLFSIYYPHWGYILQTKGFSDDNKGRGECGNLLPGVWNHLVVTVEQLEPLKWRYDVFINGKNTASKIFEPLIEPKHAKPWDAEKAAKGKNIEICPNFWGTVDNLSLYNYPLDEDEVEKIYRAQLSKHVAYYDCEKIENGKIRSVLAGDYPEDRVIDNRWAKERDFSASVGEKSDTVEGIRGKGISIDGTGIIIPDKVLSGLSQGEFTFGFYFKYQGKGFGIVKTKVVQLGLQYNSFNGFIYSWDYPIRDKTKTLKPDTWYHLAFTYDKRKAVIYIDGDVFLSCPIIGDGITFSNDITVGGGQGAIDEINIYNYAISPEQAKRLAGK